MPGFRTWDDYLIPGTTTLKNKFTSAQQPYGEEDPDKLRELEEFAASIRLAQLRQHPIRGHFDYDHIKAIHRFIFQDVYDWAGQERVAPTDRWMTKAGHGYYPAGPVLTEAANREHGKLARKNLLRGLSPDDFVRELADSWGEINVIHFAREGNTRTQMVFFSQLAEQAGYRIDTEKLAGEQDLRDEFVVARFHCQDTGSSALLAEVLAKVIR